MRHRSSGRLLDWRETVDRFMEGKNKGQGKGWSEEELQYDFGSVGNGFHCHKHSFDAR